MLHAAMRPVLLAVITAGACCALRPHEHQPSLLVALQLRFSRQPTVSARGTAVVVDGASLLITPLRHTGECCSWGV